MTFLLSNSQTRYLCYVVLMWRYANEEYSAWADYWPAITERDIGLEVTWVSHFIIVFIFCYNFDSWLLGILTLLAHDNIKKLRGNVKLCRKMKFTLSQSILLHFEMSSLQSDQKTNQIFIRGYTEKEVSGVYH